MERQQNSGPNAIIAAHLATGLGPRRENSPGGKTRLLVASAARNRPWFIRVRRSQAVGKDGNGKSIMATARKVVDVDKSERLAWFEILDSEGGTARYHKNGPAPAGATVHIRQTSATSIWILPDGSGGNVLCQDGPGLPPTINVELQPVNPAPPGVGAGVIMGGWGGGIFIYEQRKR